MKRELRTMKLVRKQLQGLQGMEKVMEKEISEISRVAAQVCIPKKLVQIKNSAGSHTENTNNVKKSSGLGAQEGFFNITLGNPSVQNVAGTTQEKKPLHARKPTLKKLDLLSPGEKFETKAKFQTCKKILAGNKKNPNSTAKKCHQGQPRGLGQTEHVPQGSVEIDAERDNEPDGDRQVQTLEILPGSFIVPNGFCRQSNFLIG